MPLITRRNIITGLATLFAAPAIVRASSLMPVRAMDGEILRKFTVTAYDAYGQPMSLILLRDRTLHGLKNLYASYEKIPTQWELVFDRSAA